MFGLIFASAFIAALSGALMPGPMLTAVVEESSKKGFLTGPLYIAGHALLELLLIILIAFGIGRFLLMPAVRTVCFLAGGPVLIWFAIALVLSMKHPEGVTRPASPVLRRPPAFLNGILISAANPYWILWWVTSGTASLAVAAPLGPPGYAVFFLGHILADLLWYSLVSFGASRAGRFLSPAGRKGISIVCAVFLVLFGLLFFGMGLMRLKGGMD